MGEPQYAPLFEHEPERLGRMTGHAWANDPKRLLFTAARYKFVAKMLAGRREVLEIGCADAFFSRIVQQCVWNLTAVDFDKAFVSDAHDRMTRKWPFICAYHDLLSGPLRPSHFDSFFALDVIEHIDKKDEETFLRNAVCSMRSHGVAIIGTPSLQSQHLASDQSKVGHINCKTGPQLKTLMERHFHSVFSFSMNDEVVHTGHHDMAHYLFAVCADPRAF